MTQNSRIVSLPLDNSRTAVEKGTVIGYEVVSGKLVVKPMSAGIKFIGVSCDINYTELASTQVPAEVRIGVAIDGVVTAKVSEDIVAGDFLKPGTAGDFVKGAEADHVAIALYPAKAGGFTDALLK